ncbi:uncharacterized protein LOC129950459 [Eupeodes corollae]|uniref:uncharacterized protein LOC129950459 n=1 Tax=Eupeodes corollae TaxID=290404 RepID=UPI002492A396|nr:uncharacterized protein LOC129950459 [Eupeodes corollae]
MSVSKQLEQTFVLEEIGQTITLDSSQLVREIKNYPIIYDNNSRRDQTSIFLAWESICTKMIPRFPSMSENDKIATRKRLRDRWSYMRSTFRRDVLNDNIHCHNHLDWIQELNFLVPILTRTAATSNTTKNSRRHGKYKNCFNKKKTIPQKTTSTITKTTTTSNSNNHSLQLCSSTSETAVITENSEIVAVSITTESSICDTVISCDSSSSSDNSSTASLDLIKSNPMQTTAPLDENSHNDLLVQTFMSTLNSESVIASIVDPDQIFLLTLLQNYRLVRSDKKEALQHKFYTFLRD